MSEAEVMGAAGWKRSTLQTHRNKNALDPFLAPLGNGSYRVRRPGSTISKDDITQAFTQIRPTDLVLSPGDRLTGASANYELVSELGRGAVAHVWKATRILGRKECAVKVLNPRADLLEPSTFTNVRQRFGREARNGMKLRHENLISYTDVGEFQEHPFLVMELAEESLGSIIETGRLTTTDSLGIVESCANGLRYLHEEGCIHRDVKPPNVLRIGSRFVLGDLGIVRWSDMNSAFTSAGTITRAALQLGSWYYMAPEQRQSPHEATTASDVYELGVTWYEMLTRQTPDPAAVAAQAFADPSEDVEVTSLIRRMLRYIPDERATVGEIIEIVSSLRLRQAEPT